MLRSLHVIVAAIQLSQPRVSSDDAERFATALREQAKRHDFDPFTGVAVIFHESSFNPKAVSKNGEDYGLAQIRARYIGGCKDSPNPVESPSAACVAQKQRLLQPEENIRIMAELITRHRDLCQRKVGSTKLPHWLASYQGRNDPRSKRWCKPGKGTWKIVEYRRYLIQELYKRGLLKQRA